MLARESPEMIGKKMQPLGQCEDVESAANDGQLGLIRKHDL